VTLGTGRPEVVGLAQQPVESRVKARMTPFDSRERLDGRATGRGPQRWKYDSVPCNKEASVTHALMSVYVGAIHRQLHDRVPSRNALWIDSAKERSAAVPTDPGARV
jgi:hypothetical protein